MALSIRRILVPVDFSDPSRQALLQALLLAEREKASIDLVHVWEPPWNLAADAVSMMAGTGNSSVEVYDLEQAERDLRAWVERYRSSTVPLRARLEQGPVIETLLRVANEGGYDTVVMGTHGRTGLARLLLGSVAKQLAERCPCPVLTVEGTKETEATL